MEFLTSRRFQCSGGSQTHPQITPNRLTAAESVRGLTGKSRTGDYHYPRRTVREHHPKHAVTFITPSGMGLLLSPGHRGEKQSTQFKATAQTGRWRSLGSKAGRWAPEAVPLTAALGRTPSGRDMEDEPTVMGRGVISRGGSCRSEDRAGEPPRPRSQKGESRGKVGGQRPGAEGGGRSSWGSGARRRSADVVTARRKGSGCSARHGDRAKF